MPVLDAIWLFVNISYAQLDAACLAICIGNTVQLINPSENLAIGEGDYLVIFSGFRDGEREVPALLTQSVTVYLVYEFLAGQLFRYIKRLLSAIDFESYVLCTLRLNGGG